MLEISNTLSGQKRFWFRKSKSGIILSCCKCMRGLCSPWLALLLVALQKCFLSWIIFGTNLLCYRRVWGDVFHCTPSINTHWNLHKMPANLQLCSSKSIHSLIQPHHLFFCEELQALYINGCVLLVYQCCLGSSQSLICNWNKIVAV